MGLDAATFDAIYAANADRLYSTAYRLLGDADAAADVVQDAFLKAYTATDEILEPAAWLTTVARNNALNVLRRSGRLAPLAEEAADDEEPTAPPLVANEPAADPLRAAATADALAIVDELLASLAPTQRTALLLFHAQEQPISAIADALGRTVNATTVFLHRSRAALRSRYADRVYGRMNVPPECQAFRPELLAHVEGKPATQAYVDHLAVDSTCQAIEAELRGMGRVLGVLPIVPAPAGLQASVEAALAAEAGAAVAAGAASSATTSGGTPATASTAGQASHGVSGFLGTAAGKVAIGVVTLAIVVAGALIVLQQPAAPAPVSLVAAQVLGAFDSHNCAIRSDRTLVCWGDSNNRKLDVPEGEFTAVSAGRDLSCAIRVDGTIACWGYSGVHNETAAPDGTFSALSTGGQHTCAIRSDGALVCWGWNHVGQADAPAGTFSTVAAGSEHTCAIRSDGTLACWGGNDHGEADPPAGTFRDVAAGQWRSCGIRDDGTLACWGTGYSPREAPRAATYAHLAAAPLLVCDGRAGGTLGCLGQLMDTPVNVPGGTYTSVALGSGFHACAVRADGGVDCWAEGGQLPATDAPAGTFIAVAVGAAHACALDAEGRITCWGQDFRGETVPPPGRFRVFTADPAPTQAAHAAPSPSQTLTATPTPAPTPTPTAEPTTSPTPAPTPLPTPPPAPDPTPLELTGADIHITAGDLALSYEYDQPWCPIGPGNTFGTYPAGVPGTDGRDWSTQMFILAWSDDQPTDWSFILSTPPGVSSAENDRRLTSGPGMHFVDITVEEEAPTRLLLTTRFYDPELPYGETLPGTVEIVCR